MAEKQQVVIRLDKDLVKLIDHLSVDWENYRGEAIERLLTIAIQQLDKQGELQFA